MSHINSIYNQLLQFIPRHEFEKLVFTYSGDHYTKYFNSWQQFISILYAQITGKDSLRDIVTGLRTQHNSWYHIGLVDICRSTFSDANNKRDYRIFEGTFNKLLYQCKDVTPKHKFRFKNPLYSIDATIIDLCMSAFPWAKFRKTKGAIKLHCLLDHNGSIPDFLVITDGKQHEVKIAKNVDLPLLPDSIISMDRAYIDYKWLYKLNNKGIWFVTRSKSNIKYRVTGQHEVKNKNIKYDHSIKLTNFYQKQYYPDNLRLIKYKDPDTKETLIFLTNNFKLSAYTITQIYKSRWQIELFFKWIKQNLKIKSFLGTSKNAVLSQIWIAMCYYLLISYIKYQTKYGYSLLEMTRLFSEALFMKRNLIDLLSLDTKLLKRIRDPVEQLSLF